MIKQCIHQANQINVSLENRVGFTLDEILVNGKTTYTTKDKDFQDGTLEKLFKHLIPSTALTENVKTYIWSETNTSPFERVVSQKIYL